MNKNTVPNEPRSPFVTSGVRIGTPAVTTRGLKEEDMDQIAEFISWSLQTLRATRIRCGQASTPCAKNIPYIKAAKPNLFRNGGQAPSVSFHMLRYRERSLFMASPLADRFRPQTIDDMVGQQHLLGPGKALRRIIESGEIPNLIFTARQEWGKPPWPLSSPNKRTAPCGS